MIINHVIDPLYFQDCINEFGFYYDWFYENEFKLDDLGMRNYNFAKTKIFGSLQPQGISKNISMDGNTHSANYNFYCMSKYRIKIGDFILFNGKYLHVNSVEEYDEYGVRVCKLSMVNLTVDKDLAEVIKFLQGESIV